MKNLFVLVVIIVLSPHLGAFAQSFRSPPAIPGWNRSQALPRDTSARVGIVLNGGSIGYSSPVIGEVDGDRQNGKETVVVGNDGKVHAKRANGTPLWEFAMRGSSCAKSVISSPAVGELFGNGVPYVVVGFGGIRASTCDGGIVAIRGTDGRQAWRFSTKAFNRRARLRVVSYGVVSTPALADTDGDRRLEVGFGSLDRRVYLLNANGSLRWAYNAADTVFSSAAFANVDTTPQLELLIGTDISQNTRLRPPTRNGGFVYAFKTTSRRVKRIAFRDHSAYLWQASFDQVIQSSPVVADVIPENPGYEVIVGSGCFFPQNSRNKAGAWLKVMDARTGSVLRTLDAPQCFSSSPAVGDLDEDGQLEVVATVNGLQANGGDGRGRLVAWKPSSSRQLWSVVPRAMVANNSALGTFTSPIIVDIDGNGSLEVLAANNTGVTVVNGRDGSALTCDGRGCPNHPLLLYAWSTLRGTPAVDDVNRDGLVDLALGGTHPDIHGRGMLYGWTGFAGLLGSPPGKHPRYSAPWPMHRGNPQRTGRF